MFRPFALIGFVYLAVQAVCIYFGSMFALWASGAALLLFGVTMLAPKLRLARVFPIACLTAAIALGSYGGYHVWKIDRLCKLAEQDAIITGTLCELPYESNGKFYYTLRVDEITIKGQENPYNPGKILMSARNALEIEAYGKISGKVHLYQSFGKQEGFSLRQSDYAKRIHMRAYLYEYEGYEVLPAAQKPPYYYALAAKKSMQSALDRLLPKEEAGVTKAVLLGDKTGLTEQVRSDFETAGTYHLLVVSGLHMTVIFQGLLKLLKLCRLPHRISCIITAFGVLCFMAITGFTPPVMRSGMMSLLFLGAMLFGRKPDALNSLGIAVLSLCLYNPYAAADLGFLLSVASTLGLILLSKPIERFFVERMVKIRRGKRFLRWLTGSVSASLAVTVSAMPILLLGFPSFSVLAFLSNLIMIPPTTVLMPTAAFSALFEAIPSLNIIAKPFVLLAGLLAKYLIFAAHWLAKIPFATVPADYDFMLLWLAMTLFLLATALFLARRKLLIRTVMALSVILLVAGVFSYQLANRDTIRVSVLDVSEGLSVVVTAGGQTAVLGCNAYSNYVTAQYLKGHGIGEITYLQAVSDENAEYRNLGKLAQSFSTERLLLPKGEYFAADLEKSLERIGEISYYEKSAAVRFNDEITIEQYGTATGGYTLLTVRDLKLLIVSGTYDLADLTQELGEIDVLITDKVPQNAEYLQAFITVLSMEGQSMADAVKYMEPGNVRLYATAGRGNLHMDIRRERELVLRRDFGG